MEVLLCFKYLKKNHKKIFLWSVFLQRRSWWKRCCLTVSLGYFHCPRRDASSMILECSSAKYTALRHIEKEGDALDRTVFLMLCFYILFVPKSPWKENNLYFTHETHIHLYSRCSLYLALFWSNMCQEVSGRGERAWSDDSLTELLINKWARRAFETAYSSNPKE